MLKHKARESEESRPLYLSIIIPVYNEEENIPLLHRQLHQVLTEQGFAYEVLYIDDGSKDDSFGQLQRLVEGDEHVRVLRFRRNYGQTAALSAGIDHSTGDVIVFMDGDLQNDPRDIPRLLAKLHEGYDIVSGWRKERQDAQWSRKFPSQLANKLISRVTGVHLHDYGCTLKAYRREILQHVRLYGEMHRLIPAYAALAGAAITELEVTHHARQYGKSKYGISRVGRVMLDLMTLKFLGSFATRPLHLFGLPGLLSWSLGSLTSVYAVGRALLPVRQGKQRQPLSPIILLFSGFGLLSILLGLVAELIMRAYYETQYKPIYTIRHVLPPIVDSFATAQRREQQVLRGKGIQ